MVKASRISFNEPKRLPSLDYLIDEFDLVFDVKHLRLKKKLKNSSLLSQELTYSLNDLTRDYYELEFQIFKGKVEHLLQCKVNDIGYLIGKNELLPIRDLVYFANKEKKYAKELSEGRERGKWIKTIPFDVDITTSQTMVVSAFIDKVITDEQLKPNDIIMLKYLQLVDCDNFAIYKIFKSVDVQNKSTLVHMINVYADGFFGKNEDYSEDLNRIEIDIIKAIQGGCNKRELKTNDATKRVIHPKASNNNCFFKCIQSYIPSIRQKLTKNLCNQIRQQFNHEENSLIDVKSALDIFREYSCDGKHGLEIWSNDIVVGELVGKEDLVKLLLEDDHYSLIEIKKYQQCADCGRKYLTRHTCNTNMIVYKMIKEGKHRYVINPFKQNKFNFDCKNDKIVIVHYDIETHTRKAVGNVKIHTPYILGFVDNIENTFQYFTGTDCMEKFVNHLLGYSDYTSVFVNAYNGSKFDHYELVKKINKMHSKDDSIKLDELLLNNGVILKASVGNISCFDISKHTTGTLRQNLEELGCTIQKGEFDYNLGDDWECMSIDDQADCLKYLQGDVLGLKKLSERLNQSCYEKFGVNLYKYLSTSQITYASWINFLYSDTNDPVFLPTAEQETFFRESIYGGRTYKYKHKFVSSQREAYMNKQIPFEDIDDYLVDADVNSLYPAAMQNEFPVGIPNTLKPNSPSLIYFNELIQRTAKCPKMGIYQINYVTNKNLLDGILPRREEGRLIWDLRDGCGIYNSVDIDNALANGYKVTIVEGYYWEQTQNVFGNYINYLYEFKKNARKGTALYKLAKLMMNGLYGKTIQRPILDENVIIHLHEEFIKYHIKYGSLSMRTLSDGSFYLTYQDEENLASKISKPCYLGSFILGFSRRIMLQYLQKTNSFFNSNDTKNQLANSPYYTDTDSIQIHSRNLRGLVLNNDIGGISDDLGDNCKILYGGWIAPKLYFLEYVEKHGDVEEIKYHLRGKGIPKSQLNVDLFESMMLGKSITIDMHRDFKRVNVNRSSKQQLIDNFSILKLDTLAKQINTVHWEGRHFIGNDSVPHYHASIPSNK